MAEKLALAGELNSLKPELEHLRSVSSAHQALLSEKLALQRQLNTLEVEIESERRAAKRSREKEDRAQAEDVRLEAKLEEVQAELQREQREKQKSEREHQKSTAELRNRITTLESRLENFRTKLKTTKESLTEAQSELQKARSVKTTVAKAVSHDIPQAAKGRKRNVSEMHADTIIGTPGDLPAAKKGRKNQALPGEKSTFSITPFLNRTASILPDAAPEESEDNASSERQPLSPSKNSKPKANVLANKEKPVTKTPANRKKDIGDPDNLDTEKQQSRKPAPKPRGRKAVSVPKLDKVAEEEDPADPDQASSDDPPTQKTVLKSRATQAATATQMTKADQQKPISSLEAPETDKGHSTSADAAQSTTRATSMDTTGDTTMFGERRKRKLLGGGLGKTLFDEDGADGIKESGKPANASKGIGSFRVRGLGVPKLGAGNQKAMTGFGAISPLKKERKSFVK